MQIYNLRLIYILQYNCFIVKLHQFDKNLIPEEKTMTLDQLYPEGIRNVIFAHDYNHPGTPGVLKIWHFAGDEHTETRLIDEIERLGLDNEGIRVLVRRVIQAMFAQWATPKRRQFFYGYMWSSALIAARAYLADDQELLKKLLLAAVIYHGGHSKYENSLAKMILPSSTKESTLQDTINYLLEVGCSEAEIRSAWATMLKTRLDDGFNAFYIVDWWRNLKVGEKSLMPEAEPIARILLLRNLKEILTDGERDNTRIQEGFLELLDFLLLQTSYDWHAHNEEVKKMVGDCFVQCLVRGKASVAFYFFIRYGRWFGFWSQYASDRHTPEEMPNTAFRRLMGKALTAAEKAHNFGVAAALAEHLEQTAEADRLHELARALKQKVALDFMFYHAVDRDK